MILEPGFSSWRWGSNYSRKLKGCIETIKFCYTNFVLKKYYLLIFSSNRNFSETNNHLNKSGLVYNTGRVIWEKKCFVLLVCSFEVVILLGGPKSFDHGHFCPSSPNFFHNKENLISRKYKIIQTNYQPT